VPRPNRKRLAGERDRLEILLEGGAFSPLAGRFWKDDALAHDRFALGLLHPWIRPAGYCSGIEEPCEPRSTRLLELVLLWLLRLGLGHRRRLSLQRQLGLGLRFRLRHAHQLLVTAALGEPLEVAPDRGAHLVEVALLAHGG
jgi:hypothetical protein